MPFTVVPFSQSSQFETDPRIAVAERDLSRRTASEYKAEILEHIVAMDAATRPDPNMIDMQPEIDWKMWPYLMDFMVDVHQKLGLEPQTLFMAVNIVNRYCARRIVYRKHLQLVGCTALWIAAKYEDKKSRVPSLAVLSHMCCSVYQEEMFVQMEGHVLHTLDWSISHCTVDTFLSVCLNHGASPLLSNLTNYLAEITLYHRPFVGMAPTVVARTIHLLALHILSFYPSLSSQQMSETEIECLEMLTEAIQTPSQTISDKYSSTEKFQVSRLVASYTQRSCAAAPPTGAPLSAQGSPVAEYTYPLTPPSSAPSSARQENDRSNYIAATAATPPHYSCYPNGHPSGSATTVSSHIPGDDSPMGMMPASGMDASSMAGIIDELVNHESMHDAPRQSPPPTPLIPPKMPFARGI